VPNFKEKQLQKFTLGKKVHKHSIELKLIEFTFMLSKSKNYKTIGYRTCNKKYSYKYTRNIIILE
jgi:hypothetical protein